VERRQVERVVMLLCGAKKCCCEAEVEGKKKDFFAAKDVDL
jgi:hypothetical protein